MKKKKILRTPAAGNLNTTITQVGTINNTGVKKILEDSIYMRSGIEKWLDYESQYALLKFIKIAKNYDKIMITGFDDTYKHLVMVAQLKNGTGVRFVVNDYAELLDNETVIAMKFEYMFKYTNKVKVTPCGTAGELYGTDDDTPMCIMEFSNGEN